MATLFVDIPIKTNGPGSCADIAGRGAADAWGVYVEDGTFRTALAHFELRSLDHDPAAVYGGEPCKTTHVVTARIDACYQPPGAVDRTEASPSEGPA